MQDTTEELCDLLEKACIAPTSQDSLRLARELAGKVQVQWTEETPSYPASLISRIIEKADNKKSGLERESAAILILAFLEVLKWPFDVSVIRRLSPTILNLLSDRGPVQEAALLVVDRLCKFSVHPVFSSHGVIREFCLKGLETSAKWQAKLKLISIIGESCKLISSSLDESDEYNPLDSQLIELVRVLGPYTHDTKKEIQSSAISVIKSICRSVIKNADVYPHIDNLVECIAEPNRVTQSLQGLAKTTFVADVKAPVLCIIAPLLARGLRERSISVQRNTLVIIDNLCRLVNDKRAAKKFLVQLLPGVRSISQNAAMPEIRAAAARALETLHEAGAQSELSTPSENLVSAFDIEKFLSSQNSENNDVLFKDTVSLTSLSFEDLTSADVWKMDVWEPLYVKFMAPWYKDLVAQKFKEFYENFYMLRFGTLESQDGASQADNSSDRVIVDVDFSLAYGGMLLLLQSKLLLRAGHRYGVCGANGAGKSTLLRAISTGKVEGFPSLDNVKCMLVEYNLSEEDNELSIVSFVQKTNPEVDRAKISACLDSFGINSVLQERKASTLSGGWRMKVELARAIIADVDILLLDEPTNHLDVTNVAWLQNYLVSQKDLTCLIVSHDPKFLDAVCTDIIHYENKHLKYYKGNLSRFVEKYPAAKSYYSLASPQLKFTFPDPGLLSGINSNTKSILRIRNVSFSYPGSNKKSLDNVSCSINLSSRVGIIGANGAGKSTMIKLLTGELDPDEGVVEKHPNLRIGYVAQHSLHHIDKHLDLTANKYIQWRYQFGEDREVLEKASRKLTSDEIERKVACSDGTNRTIEYLAGRQKQKKSFQYEIKWKDMESSFNSWISRERLVELGFEKMIQRFDDFLSSRDALGSRELIPSEIRKHVEGFGLDGEIVDNNELRGLSGGQKVKVVFAAVLWSKPHLLVLDEPSNFLDREALASITQAILQWNGALIMISHNSEFMNAICNEQWHVEAGKLTEVRKYDKDAKSMIVQEMKVDESGNIGKKNRKKKLTKKDLKDREVRRRLRHIEWLSSPKGTPKPVDTDSD